MTFGLGDWIGDAKGIITADSGETVGLVELNVYA